MPHTVREVIPRSRFKKMMEGASRRAFSCNFFATRQVVYSKDPSIDAWFKQADSVATKDSKEREVVMIDLEIRQASCCLPLTSCIVIMTTHAQGLRALSIRRRY